MCFSAYLDILTLAPSTAVPYTMQIVLLTQIKLRRAMLESVINEIFQLGCCLKVLETAYLDV